MVNRSVVPTAALAALVACRAAEPRPSLARPPAVAITAATAHLADRPIVYRTSGTVRSRITVAVTSKRAAYVRAVHVAAGDHVRAGQVLIELAANDVRAGVSRAQAEVDHAAQARVEAASGVEAARVAAQLAETSRGRVRTLLATGAATRQQADEAETQAQAGAAQLAMAEARLRAASAGAEAARAALAETQAALDDTRVVAPFAGVIVERRVEPGSFAAPGVALLVLDDEAALRVEAAVDESRGGALALGDPVTLEAAGATVPGTIGELSPAVDIASRTFVAKLDLARPLALRPGSFAIAEFHLGSRSRLVVPATAITTAGALERVFVIDHGVARLRMITVGDAQDGQIDVLSGLAPGERVVVAPPPELRDGDSVEVRS